MKSRNFSWAAIRNPDRVKEFESAVWYARKKDERST
jgi:hypothetical protein